VLLWFNSLRAGPQSYHRLPLYDVLMRIPFFSAKSHLQQVE